MLLKPELRVKTFDVILTETAVTMNAAKNFSTIETITKFVAF